MMKIVEMIEYRKEIDKKLMDGAGIERYPFLENKINMIVEIGELLNEKQTIFKYWKRHAKDDNEKALEELADCLHMACSLEGSINKSENICDISEEEIQEVVEDWKINNDEYKLILIDQIIKSIATNEEYIYPVLLLCLILGFTIEELEEAFYKKGEKVLKREEQGY